MKPFWEQKPLDQLSHDEWESLCDGCGRCCLVKLEDEETGEVFNTTVACRLLSLETCRCNDYKNRLKRVPVCVQVDINNKEYLEWMPSTCSYRMLAEGKKLPEWHPLISGNPESVHTAGISVSHFAISEEMVDEELLEEYIFEQIKE